MNNRPVFAELLHLAGDAVIKTHAKSEQQIRAGRDEFHLVVRAFARFVFAVHRPIGKRGAMHAQPAKGEADASPGNAPQPMMSGRHRNAGRHRRTSTIPRLRCR